MPTYWLLTLTLVVVGFLPWLPTADLIANLLFLQDFCRLPSLLPVAWSLVIEAWSYFLYALLAWASRAGSDFFQQGRRLLRCLPPGAAWLAFALLLVPLLAGLIRWELASQGLSVQSLKQGLWPNLDALSYGGILAWFQRAGFSRFERLAAWRFLLPVCLLLMALLGATAPFLFADVGAGLPSDVRVWFAFGFYPCVGLLSCMLIISLWHFSYAWLPQWLAIACGALSRCSYSVYLVHLAVVAWLAPIGVGMPVFVLYVLLSILVGSASWRLLESPFSRLRYSFS
jgi:peptidoglycan/LPS O-acetylase OafA/YrhL